MPIRVEGRTIYDVSVISVGETVDGRFKVTASTLADVLALMVAKRDGTKVLADHDAEVEDLVGRLINPRASADRNSIRADLEVFDSAGAGAIILEAAAKMPGEFGLSINTPDARETEAGLRVAALTSVDLAGYPAANRSGLLSAAPTIDKPAPPDTHLDTITMTPDEIEASITAALSPITAMIEELKARLDAMEIDAPDVEVELEAAAVKEADASAADAAKMKALCSAVSAQLRADLGLSAGIKLAVSAPEVTRIVKVETPASKLETIVTGYMAAGKSRPEAYRLAAHASPDIYRAAAEAGIRV